jgi:hypothetical protein
VLSDYPSLLPPCVSFTHSAKDPFLAGKLKDRTIGVREAFAKVQLTLLSLPDNPYPVEEQLAVKVGKTRSVRFDLSDYTVPHTQAGELFGKKGEIDAKFSDFGDLEPPSKRRDIRNREFKHTVTGSVRDRWSSTAASRRSGSIGDVLALVSVRAMTRGRMALASSQVAQTQAVDAAAVCCFA